MFADANDLQISWDVCSSKDPNGRWEEDGKHSEEVTFRTPPVWEEVLQEDLAWKKNNVVIKIL